MPTGSTRTRYLAVFVAATALLGCASVPMVSVVRQEATGIDRNMAIATLLLYHERCLEHREKAAGNCAPDQVTASMNQDLATCVQNAFAGTRYTVNVMPGHVFHERYLARAQPKYQDLDKDQTIKLLSAAELRNALQEAGFGYVVLFEAVTREHDRRTGFDPNIYETTFGRESVRDTSLVATVWSVDRSISTGTLNEKSEGVSGWILPVILVFPLLPIPYESDTESNACKAIGRALAEFLYSNARPLK
jgi:hypothetical protein